MAPISPRLEAVSFSPLWNLAPAITAIALGAIFVPGVAMGVAVAAAYFLIEVPLVDLVAELSYEEGTEFEEEVGADPLFNTVGAPIIEECIFRGCIVALIPTGAISVAAAVAIVATSILFGAIHADADHPNAKAHAVIATGAGLVFGIIAWQFGLFASIAAHMAINTYGIGTRCINKC